MNLENAVFTIKGKAYGLALKEVDGTFVLTDQEGRRRTLGRGVMDGFLNLEFLVGNSVASYYHVEGDSGEKKLIARDSVTGQVTELKAALVTTSGVSAHFTSR